MLIYVRPYLLSQATPEPSVTESVVSDSDAVVVSKEDLEESINQAIVCTHACRLCVINV